jgi:hypothetical protein
MRIRGLLIAVGALLVLGGAVYWSNKAKKAEEGKPSPDAPPQILTVPAEQVQQIEVQRPVGAPLVIRKQDSGGWSMTSPPQFPVDQDAAGALASTLSSLASERLVEEKTADLAQFGLAAPALQVTVLLKDGKSKKLLVGDEAPAGGGSFARIEGDPRVFTVSSYSRSSLDKTPQDLRDKRLLRFDSEKLTRVELTVKGQTIEFGKNAQNEWQIIKPQPLRADGGQVEELVQKLSGARMDLSLSADDEKKSTAAFTASTPVGTARFTDAAGTQQLEVRRDKDKNCYARSSIVEGSHKVSADLGQALDKSLADFRNKKLFDFGWSDPTQIEIRDGGTRVVYQKSADKWMAGGKQMDPESINALLDKLRELAAAKFVEGGYTAPVFEAAVTSNDGKRVERVLISQRGSSFVAMRENEPSLYELDSQTVEQLRKAAAEVKEYQPPKSEKSK